MGLLQPDDRHGGGDGAPELGGPAFIVRSYGEAVAVLAAAQEFARPIVLLSAPGAAGTAGCAWFREMIEAARLAQPGVAFTAFLDCDDGAGYVLGALREGLSNLVFVGPANVAAKLRSIAAQSAAVIVTQRPAARDLEGERDIGAIVRARLAA